MTGFGPPDDDDCCSGCGVRMDVIGPPGPIHRQGCPDAPASQRPGRRTGRNLTTEESDYLFNFDPLPETAEEIEILLEARRTGRKLSPPKRGWSFA